MLYFPLSETSPASEKTVQPTFDIVCNRLLKMTLINSNAYGFGACSVCMVVCGYGCISVHTWAEVSRHKFQ